MRSRLNYKDSAGQLFGEWRDLKRDAMVQATEVFTPTDVPTLTYVERASRNFEADLRNAFKIPKMIVSISGPSKSGKTVLVTKVVAPENLIHIYGASIKTPEDLWSNVLTWMGGPIERTETAGLTVGGELSATVGGKGGIPLVAEAKTDVKGGVSADGSTSTTKKYSTTGLDDIVREIGDSDYVVFIDDFHYIERSVREEIGKQIKAAAEKGIRICTASVPHRSDDVVRSNPELRGRVTAIDMSYWTADELEKTAFRGFSELNVDLAPAVIRALADEAFGSPQLMQAISLIFCFEKGINETQGAHQRIEIDSGVVRQIFERTSATTDYSKMLNALHAGPKQRGIERKQFNFTDGTRGDVYRCVLLAMRADPPSLSFRYEDILRRVKEVCTNESPVGSSVAESLAQMAKLAMTVQTDPVIEWDEDVLDIVEPYFLFFLRCSPHLARLAKHSAAQADLPLGRA
jgi:hypothetical protein